MHAHHEAAEDGEDADLVGGHRREEDGGQQDAEQVVGELAAPAFRPPAPDRRHAMMRFISGRTTNHQLSEEAGDQQQP